MNTGLALEVALERPVDGVVIVCRTLRFLERWQCQASSVSMVFLLWGRPLMMGSTWRCPEGMLVTAGMSDGNTQQDRADREQRGTFMGPPASALVTPRTAVEGSRRALVCQGLLEGAPEDPRTLLWRS